MNRTEPTEHRMTNHTRNATGEFLSKNVLEYRLVSFLSLGLKKAREWERKRYVIICAMLENKMVTRDVSVHLKNVTIHKVYLKRHSLKA